MTDIDTDEMISLAVRLKDEGWVNSADIMLKAAREVDRLRALIATPHALCCPDRCEGAPRG